MQTTLNGSSNSATPEAASPSQGIFLSSNEIVWARRDWATPVGLFPLADWTRRTTVVGSSLLTWVRIAVAQLWLGHRATVLLLQGMPLSQLLIPNHEWRIEGCEKPFEVGHLVLRVDSWEYWRPRPVLTNLVLASLGDIPAELSAAEVLGALAADSAA